MQMIYRMRATGRSRFDQSITVMPTYLEHHGGPQKEARDSRKSHRSDRTSSFCHEKAASPGRSVLMSFFFF